MSCDKRSYDEINETGPMTKPFCLDDDLKTISAELTSTEEFLVSYLSLIIDNLKFFFNFFKLLVLI